MGKYVYKNKECMEKMHHFYDKAMASLEVDYKEYYVKTSFGRTHIVIYGDRKKKPIITLHGGNGINPLNIRLFLPLLTEYCIIAPDVIGMPGKSAPFRNLNTWKDDYGIWLTQILDRMHIRKTMFVVSSYGSAMLLSLAKIHPERITKSVLLVPSGIAHGPLFPMLKNMLVPFINYYIKPSKKNLKSILHSMFSEGDQLWYEFMDLMMSCYKMELRPPREFTKKDLERFQTPVFVIASPEDIFFPDYKVFSKAREIFSGELKEMRISGKHLPSQDTMEKVCSEIVLYGK